MDNDIIAIKTSKGMRFIKMQEILCCVAQGRYTKIFTTGGHVFLLTRVLKEIEDSLPYEDFFRTHKSFLINLNHITSYHRNKDAPIILTNNMKIQLAKRRKQEFHHRIRKQMKTF